MHKLNTFEMLPKENANEMYSRLNVIVEELNGLGLNKMSLADVARRILCVLPIDKYGHIVIVLHQGDLSTATPTSILGKINAHEMYMHINPQDSSSSSKKEEKKDLALKAILKGKSKKIEVESSCSSDDDANIALMVKRTTKMLKKLNKNGVNFNSKKNKFFISSKRKPISEMDCYNCGELGHLAHQCPKPKKDKYKKKNKDKDDSSDDEKNDKKTPKKKYGKKKEYHKKKNVKADIVGVWLTDIESSCDDSSVDDSDDEKVATIAINSSYPPPSPSSSSSTHLCHMAKGDQKVQSENENSESDSEFESPSYDELVNLLKKYSKIIRKTRAKNNKLENENESLLAKLKSSVELRDQNEIMTANLKELKLSLKELKEKHDKLEVVHGELITRHKVLKEEFITLKVSNDNLELAYDLAINETHVATNHVAKLDVATSCDDLLVESIGKCGSCKGNNVVVVESYDDTIKIKQENEKIKCENVKLKKDLEEQTKHNNIIVETLDHDKALAYENKKLKEENQYLNLGLMYDKQDKDESFILEELDSKDDPIIKRLTLENKKLKLEKDHLTKGLAKFTRGKDCKLSYS